MDSVFQLSVEAGQREKLLKLRKESNDQKMHLLKLILASCLHVAVAIDYYHGNECPGVSIGRKCLIAHRDDVKTWADAEAACQSDYGGHLAHITDDESGLVALRMMGSDRRYWIGLSDRANEGTFVWTDGQSLNYTNWDAPAQPDGAHADEDCVEVWTFGSAYWNDVNCSYTRPYICEIETVFPNCELEWDNMCYVYFNATLKRSEAAELCSKYPKGALLQMDSYEIRDLIRDHMTCEGYAWLQGVRNDTNSSSDLFVWDDGTGIVDPMWGPNEPNNNDGVEYCTEMKCSTNLWNDRDCNNPRPAICQWELPICDHELNGMCYTFRNESATYENAASNCATTFPGGALARIDTQEIFDFVLSSFTSKSYSWIQGRRVHPDTIYYWDNGDVIPNSGTGSFWGTDQPNLLYYSATAECIALQGFQGFTWNDIACTSMRPSLCEWKLPPTTSPTKGPTERPTSNPTVGPTNQPSISPTIDPTGTPTTPNPSEAPTASPTNHPSISPTSDPTKSPSKHESNSPTTTAAAAATATKSEPPLVAIIGGAGGATVLLLVLLFVCFRRTRASVQHHQVTPHEVRQQEPKSEDDKSESESETEEIEFDAFISYNWGEGKSNHQRVRQMVEKLKAKGLKIWCDFEKVEGNVSKSMAKGINRSLVFVACITKEYIKKVDGGKQNDDCHAEFNHALLKTKAGHRDSHIIPIALEPGLNDPASWLKYAKESVNFTKISSETCYQWTEADDLDKSMDGFANAIRTMGQQQLKFMEGKRYVVKDSR